MPVVQISRIQHRRGKATDLPQLAAGELGWVIDDQKLYIGNGTMADGAPAVGNTQILTSGSTSTLSSLIDFVYKGYLGTSTVVNTLASGDHTRTLQQRLDDYVSVKAFNAKGDSTTDDTAAIQRAIDEIYCETDKSDKRSRRILFFPAGQYKVTSAIKVPPYAHLVGEGVDKTVLYQTGGGGEVIVFQDSGKNVGASIGEQIVNVNFENMTIQNGEAKVGVNIERAKHVRFSKVKFAGTYASGGTDNDDSRAIIVTSSATYPVENIIFESCQFTKFARLIDLSYDATGIRFRDCDFSTAYYGALIGEGTADGSTASAQAGPKDVQFLNSRWSDIGQQAIKVFNNGSIKNVISFGNWYSSTVANNFEGIGTLNEVPVVEYLADECISIGDFFERSDSRRTDGSSHLNIAPELQGIGRQTNSVKQVTLANNTSAATSTTLEFAAGSGNLGKSIVLNYKIERGSTVRAGMFTIGVSTNGISTSDDYTESNGDAGVTLSATLGRDDSTATDRSVIVNYTTTNTGAAATMDVEVTQLV